MKILVVLTGGTISSVEKDGWISTDENAASCLFERYSEKHTAKIEFVAETPFMILSENLSAQTLNSLISLIDERIAEGYKKIIVCHGTDTLQFTAAALAYTVSGKGAGIVLVSSNYPLGDKRANGFDNFEAAAEFLKGFDRGGVFVSYKNRGSNAKILPAARLCGFLEGDDRLFDLDGAYAAEMIDGKLQKNSGYILPESRAVSFARFCEPSGIVTAESVPSSAYQYDLNGACAVIFKPYHSGTLNTQSPTLEGLCASAREKGIPLFLVNARKKDVYESSKELKGLGINALEFCSFAAIYVKVWLARSLGADIEGFTESEIYGEFGLKGAENV